MAVNGEGGAVAVLVVDDQELFRGITCALVGVVPGWRVVAEAASGEEGVILARQIRPAVVLMDVYLPGINGIEATRRIIAGDPTVNVLLMSSYAVEDLPPGADDCGAAGYIRKDDLTPAILLELSRRS
ncbi:response regulator transcription factor [Parafrankia sp. BMG5.11]|uniref:response regulator n=1 Tax=Parafrankia sp. BMG5.11 TaxID=222540 RepID=UPI000DA5E0ED|nr:response regulator transcription factor [Parafrankia sp. BMG5.11]TCJ34055.1 response regulator transcription factor [Parafrankia sp. BMG5.11]SQD97778.1 Histidine kinase [Parafrankia sp. Ea1.12]